MKNILFAFIIIASFSAVRAQKIGVFFNQPVDNSISVLTDALWSSHLEDSICKLINSSQKSLDIAVWDNGSEKIVLAINSAYVRGVNVRYISSSNSTNTALSGLNSNIYLLKRNSGITTNVMHNKFMIIDSAVVFTGSMNFGLGSMEQDFNNSIIVNDSNLAMAYTIEFNEMWGSSGLVPDMNNSKFGPNKTDNTVHEFTIGGCQVASYFSPTDQTTAHIVTAINSATYSLDIAMFTFINNDIGDAVIAAKNRGVEVRCIIENVSYFGSEYNSLLASGISVVSHEAIPYDFHHKYAIIDACYPNSDPIVISGSHNWTNSAEEEYDENTLIIHSEIIANQYLEEFSKRFSDYTALNAIVQRPKFSIFPNPNRGSFIITLNEKSSSGIVEIFDIFGRKIYTVSELSDKIAIQLDCVPGLYWLRYNTFTTKFVVE